MDRIGLICRTVLERPEATQRELAQELGVSLGMVNGLVRESLEKGYIAETAEGKRWQLTEAGRAYLEPYKVDGALLIAAGFGSRFVPLTFETPKGLLEVFGERMIERQIRQLHAVGIHDITIAVGYLKEKFEYLIDKYGVTLLYNPEYAHKNTLATVYRARRVLEGRNVYLLSSDNWMRENMYHAYECGAWYSASFQQGRTKEWCLSFNKRGRITAVEVGGSDRWVMYGPVYFSRVFTAQFLPVLEAYYQMPGTEQFYWEQVYADMLSGEAAKRIGKENPALLAETEQKSGLEAARWPQIELDVNCQGENQVYEFENLEELRAFDARYQNNSDNAALQLVSRVFGVEESQIHDLKCLKAGMTNKSFLFRVGGHHCICRIPGPGTGLLINRRQEKEVYEAVAPLGLTEHVDYLDPETGYKISDYYEDTVSPDAANMEDMARCMAMLRRLHDSGIRVGHCFDIGERIDFYEQLCRSHGGVIFEDYAAVRADAGRLLAALEALKRPQCLCHIDANVDNFLILKDGSMRLLDWEYAGMCDPLIDIAMCAIYSFDSWEQMEELLRLYLQREPTSQERFVLYAYAALGGLLWCLWALYKKELGEEFGEYTIIMYRYAKNGYKKLIAEWPQLLA